MFGSGYKRIFWCPHYQLKSEHFINQLLCCVFKSIHEVFSKSLGMELTLLNMHGPSKGKQTFSTKLLSSQCIKVESLIMGRDLNLTLNRGEIWGISTRQDRLANLFLGQFERAGWVDIEEIELRPTWANNKLGVEGVSQAIEQVFATSCIVGKGGKVQGMG